MATRYYRVGPSFWGDHPDWSDDVRLAALYVLTSPHRSTEGLFRMPLAYAATDLGWSAERFAEAFAVLLADGFVEYDEKASVCLIVNALRWQAPENPNQARAAVKAVTGLPRTPLLRRFVTLSETLCERLAKELRRELGERIAQSPSPSPAPSQETASAVSSPDDHEWSADVVRLCDLLSGLIRERVEEPEQSRKHRPTRTWHREMDRLIRLDGRSPEQVEWMIRWVHRDEFWGGVVLSAPTLREKFGQLVAAAKKKQQANGTSRAATDEAWERLREQAAGGDVIEGQEAAA